MKKLIPLLERVVVRGEILESDAAKLPKGVLCRVAYPICNIGEKNHNNRIYEKAVWEKVHENKDIQEKLRTRTLFGMAEHPEKIQTNLEKASHVVTKLFLDESQNKERAVFDVLDTPYGKIIDTLLQAGCQVGISTRAEGELEEATDGKGDRYLRVVPEAYRFVTVDFTADPSTHKAYPEAVERDLVGVVKKGLEAKKIDSEYATVLLESLKCNDAKCLLENIKKIRETSEQYKSLEDAMPAGPAKIWYAKPELTKDTMMGYSWLSEKGMLPDPNNLEKTHVLLGSTDGTLDDIYTKMQGEMWSPQGQARELIQSKGLHHTSMSVGDIIEVGDKVWLVDNVGFVDLRTGKTNESKTNQGHKRVDESDWCVVDIPTKSRVYGTYPNVQEANKALDDYFSKTGKYDRMIILKAEVGTSESRFGYVKREALSIKEQLSRDQWDLVNDAVADVAGNFKTITGVDPVDTIDPEGAFKQEVIDKTINKIQSHLSDKHTEVASDRSMQNEFLYKLDDALMDKYADEALKRASEAKAIREGQEVKVASMPNCDFCAGQGKEVPAKYDGKTKMGPWANMCDKHFKEFGIGLGTGKGQKLVLAENRKMEGEPVIEGEVKERYWDNKGKYQKEYNTLWDKLIPGSGEAKTTHGELLRLISRIYYDWYNNGFANLENMEDFIDGLRYLSRTLGVDIKKFVTALEATRSEAIDTDDAEEAVKHVWKSEDAFEKELEEVTDTIIAKVNEIEFGESVTKESKIVEQPVEISSDNKEAVDALVNALWPALWRQFRKSIQPGEFRDYIDKKMGTEGEPVKEATDEQANSELAEQVMVTGEEPGALYVAIDGKKYKYTNVDAGVANTFKKMLGHGARFKALHWLHSFIPKDKRYKITGTGKDIKLEPVKSNESLTEEVKKKEIHSALRRIMDKIKVMHDLRKAKKEMKEFLEGLKVEETDKKKMIHNFEKCKTMAQVLHLLYDSILKYEGLGVIATEGKERVISDISVGDPVVSPNEMGTVVDVKGNDVAVQWEATGKTLVPASAFTHKDGEAWVLERVEESHLSTIINRVNQRLDLYGGDAKAVAHDPLFRQAVDNLQEYQDAWPGEFTDDEKATADELYAKYKPLVKESKLVYETSLLDLAQYLERAFAKMDGKGKSMVAGARKLINESIASIKVSETAKHLREMKIQEAIARAERDVALGVAIEGESLATKLEKLREAYATDIIRLTSELNAYSTLVERIKRGINEQVSEARKHQEKETMATMEKKVKAMQEQATKLQNERATEYQKALSDLKESHKKEITALEAKHNKELVKRHIKEQLDRSGLKLPTNVLALLEQCKSEQEADRLIVECRDALRESLLHSDSLSDVNVEHEQTISPEMSSIYNRIEDVLTGMRQGGTK